MQRLAGFTNKLWNSHRPLVRTSVAALIGVLVVVHGYVLYRIASHMTFTVVVGFAILVILKHLGLFGSIYPALRLRFRRE